MTAPSPRVREATYLRDNGCVAAGHRLTGDCFGRLEWNHREGSGMGGRGSKARTVDTSDGVVLCSSHNARAESDLAGLAKRMGWKIPRFRDDIPARFIPFFYSPAREWRVPDMSGGYRVCSPIEAQAMLLDAGCIEEER